jgi:hypothetical protein
MKRLCYAGVAAALIASALVARAQQQAPFVAHRNAKERIQALKPADVV